MTRRIVVVAVPPVDELDLVGPLQVFNSVNRLAGRVIYTVDVVTNADALTIEGESGTLTFVARQHLTSVNGVCAAAVDTPTADAVHRNSTVTSARVTSVSPGSTSSP